MQHESVSKLETNIPGTGRRTRSGKKSRRRRGGLFKLLRSDRKFAIAIACVLASLGAVSLSLPKVWVITPENTLPVIRVSLLDMVQAWMLSRSARSFETEGKTKEALQAWLGALGNQPAHVGNLRSFVEFVLHHDGLERQWLNIGAQQSQWMVALVGTNDPTALDIAGRICLKAGMNDVAWAFLNTTNRSISTSAAKGLAEAAFKTGRLKEFAAAWDLHRDAMQSDASLGLYRAAWLALSGKPTEIGPSMAILDDAAKRPELKVLALRLRSIVEAERLDTEAFDRSFEELRSLRQDELEDHSRAWLVLEAAGKHAMAVARATAYAVPPETGDGATLLLRTWSMLRLERLAAGFSRNQLDSFSNDPNTWFLTSQMLVASQAWDEVRSVAARMRSHAFLSRVFAGYADFLDGLSERASGRTERAMELFKKLLDNLPKEPSLCMDASNTLDRMGFRSEAREVLRQLETSYGNSAEYWFAMGRLAWEQRDHAALLVAAEKAYSLDPGRLENINNLAAALLINRARPAEAVQLTLQILQKAAYQHGSYLNHAFALVRNGRTAEARKVLDDLPLSALTNEERTFWRLAAVELEFSEGNFSMVAKHLPDISQDFLYPIQKTWLEAVAKQVAAPNP